MHWGWATSCVMLMALLMPAGQAGGQEPSRAVSPSANVVGLMAGEAGSTDTEIAAELAGVLADDPSLRVMPILGGGADQAITDLINLRAVDVAIVHMDALSDTLLIHTSPRVSNVEYIAKLFQEEVHILARASILHLADLAGQPVEVGPTGGATALTAQKILGGFQITCSQLHDPETVALERLRLGQVAAAIIVGGKPVPALLRIPPASGLHFLSIPLTPQLVDTYLPSSLESAAYPGLVPQDQVVETLAVGSVLVTLVNHSSEVHRKRIDRFVDALFARFGALRQPGFHPKWHDVSLSAQVPGLKRYDRADRLLRAAAGPPAAQREARH